MSEMFSVAGQFAPQGRITDIAEFGSGNIHTTFLVTLDSEGERHFVLQRINTSVFRKPELVMQNMRICTDHIRRRLERVPLEAGRRWEVPRILPARGGRDIWRAADGSCWRAISFVEGAQSFDAVKNDDHAREVGYALGLFHTLLGDLPPERLADTLEGFHITPRYLRHYDNVLASCRAAKSPEVRHCVRFVSERREWTHVFESARTQNRLLLRPIHGDPKVGNILMDTATMRAVSIVDLDTVKPGLIHYDIGDCLRSGCNPRGEDGQPEEVYFDTGICKAVLQGYLSVARSFLTDADYYYLYDSIRLIAFELGLRFFTDYLDGNVYFKVRSPEHNLARALVQFRLTESIESQEKTIRAIIRGLR